MKILARLLITICIMGTVAQNLTCSKYKSYDKTTSEVNSVYDILNIPSIKSATSENGYQAFLATMDLHLGQNRFLFLLTSPKGFVVNGNVEVSFIRTSSLTGLDHLIPTFYPWPSETRGSYVVWPHFQHTGNWEANIQLNNNGTTDYLELLFHVTESGKAPSIGSRAIASKTKTLEDVDHYKDLTTTTNINKSLYSISLDDALKKNQPIVIVFFSPAFCKTKSCGPQIDVLGKLRDNWAGHGHFIHVDIFKNPQDMQGDLEGAQLAEPAIEWNLSSPSWTFVINGDGHISARYEGFVTFKELDNGFRQALNKS